MPPLPDSSPSTLSPATGVRHPAGILGLGAAMPDHVVENEEIAERLGVDSEWIIRRTGIRSRHIAPPGMSLNDLAAEAGRAALADASVEPEDVDHVLVATMSADLVTPNAAPVVAHLLGATKAGAMDIGAACTGTVSALAAGCAMIESDRAERVLVIGAELLSRHTDSDDKRTAALFGDGAGAFLLSAAEGGGQVGPVMLGADGSSADLITADRLSGNIQMQGHDTFVQAVARLTDATQRACAAAGAELGDIDLFVYHQANGRILSALGERLELPADRVLDCIATHGNTSAASLPLALEEARERGLLTPGAQVLLGAVGAGFTWGAVVVEWGSA